MNGIGRGCLVVACLLMCSSAARAQTVSGYGGAGVAGFSAFFNSDAPMLFGGGGVEVVSGSGVGAGGELGIFVDRSGGVLGVCSMNGVVRLLHGRDRRLVPFVTGGYTAAAGPETTFNAWNIGGGLSWWSWRRAGLRVDFRDHIRPDFRRSSHYWTIRAGIVVR